MLVVQRWHIALVLYLILVLVLLALRPSVMFDANGNPKSFGLANDETTSTMAPAFVFPILAILVFYAAAILDIMA